MPRLKAATDANGVKFYPVSISKGIYDIESGKKLDALLADILEYTVYTDVYVGTASQSSSVIDNSNFHSVVVRGRPISISNASDDYLYVIMPSEYTPAVHISGLEVPMSMDSTTTISSKSYKIWKSTDTCTGTFNVYLF